MEYRKMEYRKPETAEMIIAGGGNEQIIAEGLDSAKVLAESIVSDIQNLTYYSTGFLNTFIFSGFKPE